MKSAIIDVDQAVEKLKSGSLVAIPTETVYGLAGRIDSENALNLIFSTKKRPFFDPLIVHVSSIEQAKGLTSWWPKEAEQLAQRFWPGPLTIVLPKKSNQVSDLITSGLRSVAIRFPSHPVAQEVISKLGIPLAAPSANMFGKTSPTCSSHVIEEFQSKVCVVEGGSSDHGIESTVLEVIQSSESTAKEIKIYRPGVITKSQITETLTNKIPISYSQSKASPGHIENHYQPKKPLFSILGKCTEEQAFDRVRRERKSLTRPLFVHLKDTNVLVARKLYSAIREADQNSNAGDVIILILDNFKDDDDWAGIKDRLSKASIKAF